MICCRAKHELTEDNLYVWVNPKTGQTVRRCLICVRARQRIRYKKHTRRLLDESKAWAKSNPSKARAIWRRSELKRRHGITVEAYNTVFANQGGVCGICEKPPVGKRLAVDHSHVTGDIRGLLCANCNRAIGLLGDDIGLLEAAGRYLQTPACIPFSAKGATLGSTKTTVNIEA